MAEDVDNQNGRDSCMEIKEHSFYEADEDDSPSKAFMENEDEEEKLSES